MEPWGTSHLVVLAVFVVGLPTAWLLGRAERRRGDRRWSRALAVAIPVVHVPTQVHDVAFHFELGVSLPVNLSDLAWVAAAVALWTHHRYAVALTYFWGLVLTTQSVLTPSLGEAFPDVRFFAYWFIHLVVVWAAVFLVWGARVRPRWEDYRSTVAVTLAWAAAAYGFNAVAGTNYGYLQRKPTGGSALDLLGPWPWYVVASVVVLATVWALMTWPWERVRAQEEPATADPATGRPSVGAG
ncbi:TIGR02206 family membrane protein [Nocardioides litoris]|uniref:YwaF family protein n=1 Tax=Nocardioides litoris TaxID=1926648 RepID=UPI00111CAAE0|nr:TIGR02206 family membrane protein [Nocardioides litoris]